MTFGRFGTKGKKRGAGFTRYPITGRKRKNAKKGWVMGLPQKKAWQVRLGDSKMCLSIGRGEGRSRVFFPRKPNRVRTVVALLLWCGKKGERKP